MRPAGIHRWSALTAFLLVVCVFVAAPARGAEGDPAITLVDQTTWATRTDPFSLSTRVESGNQENLAVDISLFPRIRSRSQFVQSLDNEIRGNALRRMTPALESMPPDANGVRTFSFIPGQVDQGAGRPVTAPGVYPIRVDLRNMSADERLDGFITYLVLLPTEVTGKPLSTSLVIPINGFRSVTPEIELDKAAVERNASRANRLLQVLSARSEVRPTLLPVPETLGGFLSASPLGSEPSTEALEGLRRLAQGTTVLQSTYVPVDMRSIRGIEGELDLQLEAGKDTVVNALGVVPDNRVWFGATDMSPAALSELRDRNFDRVLIPDTSLTEDRSQRITLTSPFRLSDADGNEFEAMAIDRGLRSHFANQTALGAHHLLADLSVIYFDRPGGSSPRVVVAAPGPGTRVTATFLDIVLRDIGTSPILELASPSEAFDEARSASSRRPTVRRLVERDVPELSEETRELRSRVNAFSGLLEPANPLRRHISTAAFLTESSLLHRNDQRRYSAAVEKRISKELDAVTMPPTRSIRLTAKTGNMPVTVQNKTGYPLRARLVIDGPRLSFPVGSSQELLLDREITTARFLVKARTSGAFPITVRLMSRDGSLVLAESTVTVRSTAVSNVGIFLSVGALCMLAWWWGRHIYRDKRSGPTGRHSKNSDA